MGLGREKNGCKVFFFWCLSQGMQGFFPNSLKKEPHCCLEQRGEATHPELLQKEEGEAEDCGKESFQAQRMRDYWSPRLPRSILPEAVLEHWKRGVTSALRPWEL
jgi:hypothetical protein